MRRVLVGAGLRGARLEVRDERGDVAVAVAVELREALQRERGARLREDDARVALDELGLRRLRAAASGGWRWPWTPPARARRRPWAGGAV